MKRGIILNLIIIVILLFLILLPVLIAAIAVNVAARNNCETSGIDWGEGICQEMYTVTFLSGLIGTLSVPLFIGVLVLYLIGVSLFYIISLVQSRKMGKPLLPFAAGMMASTILVAGIAFGISGVVLINNWYHVSFISACKSLPTMTQMADTPIGELAIGAKLPYPEGRPEQYVIKIVTAQGQLVNTLKDRKASKSPAWSPEGNRIAYSAQSAESGMWGLYLADARGTAGVTIIEDMLELQSPSWAPDGQSLLFQRWQEQAANPTTEIFTVNLDGSGLHQLTEGQKFNGAGRFSPDGSRIVFVSARSGWGDIFLMNADGSNFQRLTYHPEDDIDPDWSPDGQWIVFASSRGSDLIKKNYDLYIMAADGSSQCQLTNAEGIEWKPDWSPDGNWIAYISGLEDRIHLIRPDGVESRLLTLSEEFSPLNLDWRH